MFATDVRSAQDIALAAVSAHEEQAPVTQSKGKGKEVVRNAVPVFAVNPFANSEDSSLTDDDDDMELVLRELGADSLDNASSTGDENSMSVDTDLHVRNTPGPVPKSVRTKAAEIRATYERSMLDLSVQSKKSLAAVTKYGDIGIHLFRAKNSFVIWQQHYALTVQRPSSPGVYDRIA